MQQGRERILLKQILLTNLLIPINAYTILSIRDEIKELLKVIAEKTIIKSVVASVSLKRL
jgi:hypothetical protein